jgi:two-component system, NtrC family, response regulator AtoC
MPDALSVLIVDDDESNRDYLGVLLTALGFQAESVATGQEALERLARDVPPDVVVLDVLMPGLDGMETLRRYRAAGGRVPVVMCSALDEADTVVRAMRAGATDYITKPFNSDELREILERVTADAPTRPRQVATAPRSKATALGVSVAMRRVDELIDRIADADVPVLITGESGVGKDVVARQIHARSARAGRVFVKINCAALPGELLESELFGHERGSFTGAQRTKPGQFELADGGTLFLDEIGEMPVTMQAKLLQALQDGEFYRVGGQRKIKVDTRVIVATNVDLARAMERGTFREDLYYRLNVVQVSIPPLRERREDIPQLLDHFVEKYGKRYGRTLDEMPRELIERFLAYEWPGNIRELENLVRRLMVLRDPRYVLSELKERPGVAPAAATAVAPTLPPAAAAPAAVIPAAVHVPLPQVPIAPVYGTHGAAFASPFHSPSPLPPPTIPAPPSLRTAGAIADAAGGAAAAEACTDDYRIDLKDLGRKAAHAAEREAIIIMLGHTGGNKREAAERLGISYKAILYKIREFGIGRPRPSRKPHAPSAASTATATGSATAPATATAPAAAAVATAAVLPSSPIEAPSSPAELPPSVEIDLDDDDASAADDAVVVQPPPETWTAEKSVLG